MPSFPQVHLTLKNRIDADLISVFEIQGTFQANLGELGAKIEARVCLTMIQLRKQKHTRDQARTLTKKQKSLVWNLSQGRACSKLWYLHSDNAIVLRIPVQDVAISQASIHSEIKECDWWFSDSATWGDLHATFAEGSLGCRGTIFLRNLRTKQSNDFNPSVHFVSSDASGARNCL